MVLFTRSYQRCLPCYHPIQLYSYINGIGTLGEDRVRERERLIDLGVICMGVSGKAKGQ